MTMMCEGLKTQAAMTGDLRRVTAMIESPVTTYLVLGFLLLAESLSPVLEAFALKGFLDAFAALSTSLLWRTALVYLAAMVFSAVVAGAGVSARARLVEELSRKQREALLRAGVEMPLLQFEKLPRGDLVSRLTSDIAVSSRVITECYLLARVALSAVAAAAYMLKLNWQVALACSLTGPVTMAVSGAISKPVNKRSMELQAAVGQVSSEALNTLEGVQVIKSFLAEDSAEKRFLAKASAARQAAMRMSSVFALNAAWMGTGSILPFVVTFGYGGYMAVQGRLTVGGILALIKLCNYLSWPLAGLGQSLANARRSLGAFRRVTEVLDAPRDVDPVRVEGESRRDSAERRTGPAAAAGVTASGDIADAAADAADAAADAAGAAADAADAAADTAADAGSPSITVRDLSFEYVHGTPVLREISVEIPPGALVVLAGKSGCGKSTLLKVLAGLYRPSPGTVFIGDRDLHYEAGWARSVASYLPQEPFLFSGSLRENLELAKPDAAGEELRRALAVADALDFVERDEAGLGRDVSERGSSFSGGERQRLCIARTLLRGSPVLLIDEPTSSVDRESEERIWSSLLSAMKGKTCVVASHRLDIAERADLILVMDQGRIVERGTHEELNKPGSVYMSLVGEGGGAMAG
jgi:ATP-binding cassette subfamily B protein